MNHSNFDTLCSADTKNTPEFNFAGKSFVARLAEAHDGDTVKVLTDVLGKVYKITIRLVGIDTPEVRSRNANEKTAAVLARDYLAAWAMPQTFKQGGNHSEMAIKDALRKTPVLIYVRCGEYDKYGRILATLHTSESDPTSLNQMLVASGHAIVYGTPKPSYASG